MQFIDYSSAFNTILPSTLIIKLEALGLTPARCNWVLDFLTGCPPGGEGRKQHLHFADPQHWDPTRMHPLCSPMNAWPRTPPTRSLSFQMTTVAGLITNNDETAYREEVMAQPEWCQENNLSLNINKTKELIVDFRKQQREHPPIHINGTAV